MLVPFLSLADVVWATPDGRPILSHLSADFPLERTGLIGRNGVGKTTVLRLLAGALEPDRGRVTRSATIGTMRQLVQIAPGETVADLLGIQPALELLRRAEAGKATIEELAGADWTIETQAAEVLAQVGLAVPLETPLAALSGGQRTRAAFGGAVFAQPDFLLLDEPTNNLDRDGRWAVRELLQGWRAGAIVVSHDRELLEVMDSIVELTTIGAARYGGNWSAYCERKAIELAAAQQDFEAAQRRVADIKRKAQQTVERQQRRDGAGSRKAARGDMPRILAGARRDRAEKTGGDNARVAERRRNGAEQQLDEAEARIERAETLRVSLTPSGLLPNQRVLDVEDVTFGYLPERPILRGIRFTLTGPERLALDGANGTGKSTLLELIAGKLTPWSGKVRTFVPAALFDQRMTLLDPDLSIGENFARLNPGMDHNGCRAALARFQFRAEAADRIVRTLSGGQILRAGLACVLGGAVLPKLLILDEPTNHLDIESVAAVEAGLQAFDGALLVVSHDEAFLQAVGITRRLPLETADGAAFPA